MDIPIHPQTPRPSPRAAPVARRCAICARRPDVPLRALDETPPPPAEPRTWALCPTCLDAVRAELARAALRTPYRVRIAVAVVASERAPGVRRRWDRSYGRRRWRAPRLRLPHLTAAWVVALALEPALFTLIVVMLVLIHH
jgi:hypothetical protein